MHLKNAKNALFAFKNAKKLKIAQKKRAYFYSLTIGSIFTN